MIEKTEKKDKKETGLEINILPLLLFLLKKIWVILLVGLLTAAMAFVGVKIFVHPTYRCSFTAYINNKHAASTSSTEFLTSSDVNAAKEIVKTYSAILKSNTILASADEAMQSSYSVKELKGMVTTRIQDETEIIQVFVVAKSPDEAYQIASCIASVAPKIMSDIVEGSSMKIVEYPQPPTGIFSPSYSKFALLGFGVGVLITIIVFVINYMRNDTILDEAEVESRFSVPVLGVLPDVNNHYSGKSGYYYNHYYYYQDYQDHSDREGGEKQGENEKA